MSQNLDPVIRIAALEMVVRDLLGLLGEIAPEKTEAYLRAVRLQAQQSGATSLVSDGSMGAERARLSTGHALRLIEKGLGRSSPAG